MDTRNIFVNFENGDNCLVYVSQSEIGDEDIKTFCEKVTGNKVLEVYHVPQDELQYYCIEARVWINTSKLAEKVKSIINKQ